MNGLITQAQISHRRPFRRPSAKWTVATIAAASLAASVLTGCGSDEKKDESTTSGTAAPGTTATTGATTGAPAAVDAVKLQGECQKTTETLQAVHVDLATNNLESANLPMQSIDASVVANPQGEAPGASAVGTATVRPMQGGEFKEFEFLVRDKTMYTKGDDGKYTSVGPAEQIYDPGVVLDPQLGLANIVKEVKDPKVEGTEEVEGTKTVKLTGTIDAMVVDKVIPRLGEGVTAPLPITLYIHDVGPTPTETPTATESTQASPGTGGPNLVRFTVNRDQGNVQVTLSEWGKPAEIPTP
jgi:hypothetical protein